MKQSAFQYLNIFFDDTPIEEKSTDPVFSWDVFGEVLWRVLTGGFGRYGVRALTRSQGFTLLLVCLTPKWR